MLKIIPSSLMISPNEDRIIRISKTIRQNLNIGWDDYINVKVGNRRPILMTVYKAHRDDIFAFGDKYSWVTRRTFDFLNNNNKDELPCKVSNIEQPASYSITLGSDPEFMIFDRTVQYKMYPANAIGLNYTDQVGSDNALGEIRPDFGRTHTELVNNMAKLIKSIPGKIGNDKVAKALSSFLGLDAGYHIHLGLPQKLLTRGKNSAALLKSIVRSMDYFVSVLATVGETENQRRTNRTHYGFPGDFRVKLHTLEYRTPGAYLLRCPTLSKGTLAIAKLVTDDVLSKLDIATNNWSTFTNNPFSFLYSFLKSEYGLPLVPEVVKLIIDEDKTAAINKVDTIIRAMERMRGYKPVEQDIISFVQMVTSGNIPGPLFTDNWSNIL